MTNYSCCFYRLYERFQSGLIREVLDGLERTRLGFFPMELVVGPSQRAKVQSPGDFRMEDVPAEYYISPGVVRLPLDAANGVQLALTDSDDPEVAPPNLVFEFSRRVYDANHWGLEHVLRLFREMIASFDGDLAYLYDERQRSRPIYSARMFDRRFERRPIGVFWVNFFSFRCVETSVPQFENVRSKLATFEVIKDRGYLFALQTEPYDEGSAGQRRLQEEVEAELLRGWLK